MNRRTRLLYPVGCALLLAFQSPVPAQELDVERVFEDRNLAPVAAILAKGEYELCARICEAAIQRGMKAPEWRLMRLYALMAQGQEVTARDEAELAVKTFPGHLELLLLQHENALRLGRQDIAQQALADVNKAAKTKTANERTAQEWVALGQAALALGADAKKVISQYFAVARQKDPKLEAAYLAEGLLALEKDDAARAAEVFREGLNLHGETARLRAGLAQAFSTSDREKQTENLTRALEINPSLAEAHLMRAELLIGAEKFLEAEAAIQKVLDRQENSPQAWALRAAVGILSAAEPAKINAFREQGLQRWTENPEVDHIIGRVISRAYRFAEGSQHQRQALKMDSGFLPAKVQLCHDLLRLGEEEEAWKLAASVREEDSYNIQAHNIGLLETEMQGYTTQTFDDFILKMPKRDWPVYGERALAILRDAKAALCPKYGLELKRPVLVEFFGAQQDFAIRTFGSLGGQGLLGVCFGTVITMNSPGSLAHGRNNWESTLWHEFCHVVTLSLTRNKMPRWLSEGISVYEEGQRNNRLGMAMTAEFREHILDEEKGPTPLSQLSSAFLKAKDNDDVIFAYFQSSQVVAWLLERFGHESLKHILDDLAEGKPINVAIAAHTEDIGKLEKDFDDYFKQQARAYGAKADWSEPSPEEVNPTDPASLAEYRKKHPQNLWALRRQVAALVQDEKWQEALPLAEEMISLVPEDVSLAGGHQIKADALAKLGREADELQELRVIVEKNPSAMAAILRLIETDTVKKDWAALETNAQRAIALNPFLRSPHQAAADAAEGQGRTSDAVFACRKLLILAPASAAPVHYRLARLLNGSDTATAKRHLLDALALSPRFREGHELLKTWE